MIGPKRKARKKAAREAAEKKVEEHIKYGSSRIKAMQDSDIESEKKLMNEGDNLRSQSKVVTSKDYKEHRDAVKYYNANAGEKARANGVTDAMVRYDGRTSGAPVAGGTKRQVKKSQKQALKNSSQGKQARAASKRMYKK